MLLVGGVYLVGAGITDLVVGPSAGWRSLGAACVAVGALGILAAVAFYRADRRGWLLAVVALVLFAGVNVAVDVWLRDERPVFVVWAAVSLVILLLPAVRRSFAAPAG